MVRVIKMSPNTPRQATRIHSVVDNDGSDGDAGVVVDAGPKLESCERKGKLMD